MQIRLAEPGHEPALRALVESAAMPGRIRLAFGRQPDFFRALSVLGTFNQVGVCLRKGQVVGMGCRSIKPVYVNGEPVSLGYLSGLRFDPAIRRGTILGRAYAFLRTLHADGRTPAYLTTIVEENRVAQTLLSSRRAGLPAYLDLGRYITYALPVRGRRRLDGAGGLRVRRGSDIALETVIDFLNREGRRRQFFPVVESGDIGSEYFRGLQADDFLVAFRGPELAGVLALWNQEDYKQTCVAGYSGMLRWMRPLVNGGLRVAGLGSLPPAGTRLRLRSAALVAVRDDRVDTLRVLLAAARAALHAGGCERLCMGFHERDPLREAMRGLGAVSYTARLYLAGWEEGRAFADALDPERVPYLELGAL